MKNRKEYNLLHTLIAALLTMVIAQGLVFAEPFAAKPGWKKEKTDWQTGNGSRIKSISYPYGKHPPMSKNRKPQKPEKVFLVPPATNRTSSQLKSTADADVVIASAIDSPAVDGFTPWIAISVTDERADSDTFDAAEEDWIVGNYLTSTPESSYVIGIFDTGASAHVMGYAPATRAGIFAQDLVTSNTSTISGVTGSVDAWVSQPLAIFIDSINAVEPNGKLWNRSNMMGQSNVAIMVGEGGSSVDLPTAIGSPLSVYFTTAFYNDNIITRTIDGNDYNSPYIHMYQQDDPCIPVYDNMIPLELRPLGATSVEYIPGLTSDFDFAPTSPSIITGTSYQSVFFVSSVDLYKGSHSAIDKTRFMLDTGAQVSVVGSRVAARLGLKPANPDFEVEIEGVTGEVSTAPGFYIDEIDIPALGDWLSFTNIPVILLDVSSPEGGTLDGIIGMNLFTDLNFTLRGGGMSLEEDPAIYYETISLVTGDINGDNAVDWLDVAALADAWLATSSSSNWNSKADLNGDGIINFVDFTILAQNWTQ